MANDEPSLRDALSYTLREECYRVVIAANGVEAIQAARRKPPQAIVLDVMLPGIEGLQVCRTLRSKSTVPILLLSAKGEEIDRVVGLELRLAIAKHIVQAHGGSIWAVPNHGGGTVFAFRLPVDGPDVAAPGIEADRGLA